jgi:hypothetical protein
MNQTPVEFMANLFPGKDAQYYRSWLGSYGISGNLALQVSFSPFFFFVFLCVCVVCNSHALLPF